MRPERQGRGHGLHREVLSATLRRPARPSVAQKLGVDMPITEQVYRVPHERRPLDLALRTLMERSHKDELQGIA